MDPEVWERLIKPVVPPTKVEISSIYDDCRVTPKRARGNAVRALARRESTRAQYQCLNSLACACSCAPVRTQNCTFAPVISESARQLQSEGFLKRLPASVERFRELHNAVPAFAKNDRTFTFHPSINSANGPVTARLANRGSFLARVQEDLRLRQERADALARASAFSFHPQLSFPSSSSSGGGGDGSDPSSSSRPASPARIRPSTSSGSGSRRGSFLERLTKDLESREELAREQQRLRDNLPFKFQPDITQTNAVRTRPHSCADGARTNERTKQADQRAISEPVSDSCLSVFLFIFLCLSISLSLWSSHRPTLLISPSFLVE